jgi:hypothetical protein
MHIRLIENPGNRVWWKMVGESLVEDQLTRIIDEKLAGIQGTNRATTEAWAFYDPKTGANQMTPNQAMQLTAPRSVSPLRVATTFNLQPRALPGAVADLVSR